MGCQRYPPSSDASKSREHPYEAYTSCQLWSSPAYMSFTGASIPALATEVGEPRGYKARNGGEVRESTARVGEQARRSPKPHGRFLSAAMDIPRGADTRSGYPRCTTRSRMALRIGYCSSLALSRSPSSGGGRRVLHFFLRSGLRVATRPLCARGRPRFDRPVPPARVGPATAGHDAFLQPSAAQPVGPTP